VGEEGHHIGLLGNEKQNQGPVLVDRMGTGMDPEGGGCPHGHGKHHRLGHRQCDGLGGGLGNGVGGVVAVGAVAGLGMGRVGSVHRKLSFVAEVVPGVWLRMEGLV